MSHGINSHTLKSPAGVRFALCIAAAALAFAPGAWSQTPNLTQTLVQEHGTMAPAKTGKLDSPVGVAIDAYGRLYVANLNSDVMIYNANSVLIGSIKTAIDGPVAVGIGTLGDIYVANHVGNNITRYTPPPELALLQTLTDGTLTNPVSMYVDADNTIWALDAAGTLHPYLDTGEALPSLNLGGASTVGPWESYVTVWGVPNASGGYDMRFQNRGEAIYFGTSLPGDFANFSPRTGGEAQDNIGQIYLTNVSDNMVQIINSLGGAVIAQFATSSTPGGIAVDTVRKRIYVALPTVNEVAMYSLEAPYTLLKTIH